MYHKQKECTGMYKRLTKWSIFLIIIPVRHESPTVPIISCTHTHTPTYSTRTPAFLFMPHTTIKLYIFGKLSLA
ncbi:hypothetical protein E2C01_078817 [Portunus trituberculatus]|uniref:Uncharacterized protein n=1 Tax=Portunus trituberculatus TaxID=210409 RepID=A0A5B7IFD0_PORTR|nr:hypothetical protein [Portunus trituberculatus]